MQSFFHPQTFNLLVVDLPTIHAKKSVDLAIAIPAILLGQSDKRQTKLFII